MGQCFGEMRQIFANHAKHPSAIVLVDVVILRWLIHVVTEDIEGKVIVLESPVILAMCSLAVHPQFEGFCASDVLTVLIEVERYVETAPLGSLDYLCPSLLTVIKMLNPSSITTKVEDIVAKMYKKNVYAIGVKCRVFLGTDHDFVKKMEKIISEEETCRWNEIRFLQVDHKLIIHSLCGGKIHYQDARYLSIGGIFLKFGLVFKSAIVAQDIITVWEEMDDENLPVCIEFMKELDTNLLPGQSRIYIACMIRPPSFFWDAIKSCENLKMMHKLLKGLGMKQMILTYGISILETNLEYTISN